MFIKLVLHTLLFIVSFESSESGEMGSNIHPDYIYKNWFSQSSDVVSQ